MQFLWKYVDDLVGKGLEIFQIFQLLFYASARFVPLSLPLSILISSIMFYGNLSETNQLNSLKSIGISFYRFNLPLLIFIFLVSILSFYFSNNILPYVNLKNASMIYSIQKKKPALNIREGIFYDEINGLKIKVGKKKSDNINLEDIIIYSDEETKKMIVSKRGQMLIDEKKNLLIFRLIDGYSYNEINELDSKNNEHQKIKFEENKLIIDLSSFEYMRNTEKLYKGHYAMLNNKEINIAIDSLENIKNNKLEKFKSDFFQNFNLESIKSERKHENSSFYYLDRKKIFLTAINKSQSYLLKIQNTKDDILFRDTIIVKHNIEYLRKFTLSIACLIMFIIGTSIGSMINKGGYGYPILISCSFFIIYYIISIIGEKSAKELSINSTYGMWLSNFIFFPIAIICLFFAINEIRLIRNFK
tara:strand:- start:4663 stop:5913 length:1251 start_codon:yes stop_codon:yes gene_type:complete